MRTAITQSVGAPFADSASLTTGSAPVLIIDDEPRGPTTQRWLADAGYQTTAVIEGDSVLRLVRAELMRLVVSELYIPCAEGACVVAALKSDRMRLPRLRVLVHSRHTSPADDARALEAGCDGILHKPASADSLIREVRRLDGSDLVEPGESTANRSPS
jgi:two-component system, sensor histidine kinase and response regulator